MSATATASSVPASLTEIFRSVIGNPDLVLSLGMERRDIPGWDSMAHIQLVLAVESRFKIKLSTSDIAKFSSVGQLADVISSRGVSLEA